MALTHNSTYDLIIIGGGPGGYTAALKASRAGLSTAVVEADRLGGVCLNWGCIPTKALLVSAELYHRCRDAVPFGIIVPKSDFNWATVISRSRSVAEGFSQGIELLVKKNKVTVFHGKGVLKGGGMVAVEGIPQVTLKARHIILATGGHPTSLPGIPVDGVSVVTSKEAMTFEKKPESIVIIGAGAVGVEFACFFNSFGTKVTLIEMCRHILPGMDEELSKRLESRLEHAGISVETAAPVERVTPEGGRVKVYAADGRMFEGEKVLAASGVTGNCDGLGLEEAGVRCEQGFIAVDDSCRTTADGIWAVGDCIGQPLTAHAAASEAECAVDSLSGRDAKRIPAHRMPVCVYSFPNAAAVGLTEKGARAAGHDVSVGKSLFRFNGKAVARGRSEGFVKVVIDSTSHEILGASILGDEAMELLQELVLSMEAGISADVVLKTVHPHPSLSETVREAVAGALVLEK